MPWPFLTPEQIFADVPIPTDENVLILFYPLTGGSFLPTVISCHESYYGKQYLEEMIAKYDTEWVLDDDDKDQWYKKLEFKNHPHFQKIHPRFYRFDDVLNFPNKMIYIDYGFSQEEENFVQMRIKGHYDVTMLRLDDGFYADIQMKYEKELISYLDRNNKVYHKISFASFLTTQNFVSEVYKVFDYLGLSYLEENDIARLHKSWLRSVIKYCQQKIKRRRFYEAQQKLK